MIRAIDECDVFGTNLTALSLRHADSSTVLLRPGPTANPFPQSCGALWLWQVVEREHNWWITRAHRIDPAAPSDGSGLAVAS
jgi:hypothetical protein